jgi:carboxyl-terminal processing protease
MRQVRLAYPSLLFSADRRVYTAWKISTRKVCFFMKITFSVPKKLLKKHYNGFSAELGRSIPDVIATLDRKNGYIVLELAPHADPIAVTERLRTLADQYGMSLIRVPNDTAAHAAAAPTPIFPAGAVRTVKMSRHVISLIAVALICAILSFGFAAVLFGGNSAFFEDTLGTGAQEGENYAEKIALVDFLFENYGLYDTNGKLLLDEMLHVYAAATGDRYAAYYTEEEFRALMSDMQGNAVGVGVTVAWDPDLKALCVIQVVSGSPAQKAGVLPGDLVVAIGTLAENERVSDLGYEATMKKMLGAEGTKAEFVVSRDGGEIAFSITRAKFTAVTVEGRKSGTDPSVGIIRISGFEANTPTQFKNEMSKLLQAGCTRFVYDVRDNPGGELKSVCAVLSYFANEGDVLVSTVPKQGETTYYKAQVATYTDEYAACSVAKEEIGVYRKYPAVVLANGNTASAGELFTAALRDFDLADVVGVNTFGKGVIQSIFDLSEVGKALNMDVSGGLKLTVGYYAPPSGVNYEGKGIAPDRVVELPEELKNKNLYLLDESEDVQLLAAIQNVLSK